MYIGDYAGIKVFSSFHAVEKKQFKFPRTKKKRIRKKFAKNENNYKVVPSAFMVGKDLYAHPEIARQMEEKINIASTGVFYGNFNRR